MRSAHVAAGMAAAALALAMATGAVADELPSMTQASYSGSGMMILSDQPPIPFMVNFDRGLERREMTMEGQTQVFITRPDLGVTYMLMIDMGMAMEMPLDAQGMNPADQIAAYNPVAVGSDTVLGESVTKYRLQGTDPMGGSFDGFAWISGDGIILRMQGDNNGPEFSGSMSYELTALQRGPQDGSLFELPPGVQVMQMPGGMGGAMPGGAGGGGGGQMQGMPEGAQMPNLDELLTPEQRRQLEEMQRMQGNQ